MKPPQTRRQRAAYLAQEGHLVANRQVRADFAFLAALATDEAIPIEAVHDWRTALRRAVVETQREQLLVHLPQVYEGCLMRQSLGIAHPVAAEAAA